MVVFGDKAYGAKHIRDYITEQGAVYTIPPKDNCTDPWHCDFHTCKERHSGDYVVVFGAEKGVAI